MKSLVNRICKLMVLLSAILFLLQLDALAQYGTLTFRADISGTGAWDDHGVVHIMANQPVSLNIYSDNSGGTTPRDWWSSPFLFTGSGGATTVTWGSLINTPQPQFDGFWDVFKTTYTESWDGNLGNDIGNGNLGDLYCYTGVGWMACYLPGLGELKILVFPVTINSSSGNFCVQQGDAANDAYDWLFDETAPPYPFFPKTCWEVVDTNLRVDHVYIDDSPLERNVTNHMPTFQWMYLGSNGNLQTQAEIEIGNDNNWTVAEMWDPEVFQGADTFVVYGGAPLINGNRYYLRLRINNGDLWSAWYNGSFRMNSLPTTPTSFYPTTNEIVKTTLPELYVYNSTDPENDTITYDFIAFNDSSYGPVTMYTASDVPQRAGTTGWLVNGVLQENWKYWWQARAFDKYEHSSWFVIQPFWINAVEEFPMSFDVVSPPDTMPFLFSMLCLFEWGQSLDPDPLDSITYTLILALDSGFHFVQSIADIHQVYYQLSDSLNFGTKYWWKVKATDKTGRFTYSSNTLNFRTWKLGDANGDWLVNIQDITFIINFLYNEGAEPNPRFVADINGTCLVNIQDITYLINYLYKSGPPPKIGCM